MSLKLHWRHSCSVD